jgi:hypothetical protein
MTCCIEQKVSITTIPLFSSQKTTLYSKTMISSLLPTTVRNGYFQKRYEQVQERKKGFQKSHEGVPGKERGVPVKETGVPGKEFKSPKRNLKLQERFERVVLGNK